jgi:hypothetical protein
MVNSVVALLAEDLTMRTLVVAILISGSVALVITVQQRKPKTLPPITAAIETECGR